MSWKKIIKSKMEVGEELEMLMSDLLPDKIKNIDDIGPTIENILMDNVGSYLYFNVDEEAEEADYSDKVSVFVTVDTDDDSEHYTGTFRGYVVFKPTKDGYEFIDVTENTVY